MNIDQIMSVLFFFFTCHVCLSHSIPSTNLEWAILFYHESGHIKA